MTDELITYTGKRVFLVTKAKRYYSGHIVSMGNQFIVLIDKYHHKIVIQISDISSIEEQPQLNIDGRKENVEANNR